MIIHLPTVCPDPMNTVITLQLKDINYKTDKYRLLQPNEKNILLTFDAELSPGLSSGDGKVYRNFIQNWTRLDQTITWNLRLLQPATFTISLDYNKENNADSGTVILDINGKEFKLGYDGEPVGNSKTIHVTTTELSKGEHTIILKGERFEGKQFLRPMQLTIRP